MILGEQPTEEWKPYDFKLLEAFQTLQDETCQHCGNPIWLCRSGNPDLKAKVKSARCQGKAALEARDEARSSDNRAKKIRELRPGEYEYVVFEMLDKKMPMPTRDDWIRENAVE